MTRSIPWPRILAEGFAIVVSILLAFGIQAWWEGAQDRRAEQAALQALAADFLTSREDLATGITALTRAQAGFAAFQSSSPDDLLQVSPDSAEQLVGNMVTAFTYDPVTSSLDALLSDGRISLLRDARLREALSQWVRAQEDMQENESDVRSTSLMARRAMQRHGGPFYFRRLPADALGFLPRADGEVLAELRRDQEFVGEVRTHHTVIAGYLAELGPLQDRIGSLLALINGSIE